MLAEVLCCDTQCPQKRLLGLVLQRQQKPREAELLKFKTHYSCILFSIRLGFYFLFSPWSAQIAFYTSQKRINNTPKAMARIDAINTTLYGSKEYVFITEVSMFSVFIHNHITLRNLYHYICWHVQLRKIFIHTKKGKSELFLNQVVTDDVREKLNQLLFNPLTSQPLLILCFLPF